MNSIASILQCLIAFILLYVQYNTIQYNTDQINTIQFALNCNKIQTKHYDFSVHLISVFREERDYIEEWIEYHFKLGFDHISLYDNNLGDDEKDIVNLLKQRYGNKLTIYDKRDMTINQAQWYNAHYHTLGKDIWSLYLDMDEFMTLKNQSKNIKEYLYQAIQNKCYHIKINWLKFGNNCQNLSKGSVIERFPVPLYPLNFSMCGIDHPENSVIKTFIYSGYKNGNMECHIFSNGPEPCDGDLQKLPSKYSLSYANLPIKHDTAYIRHYTHKSVEEYAKKYEKWKRHHGKKMPIFYTWKCYNELNKNYPNCPSNRTD